MLKLHLFALYADVKELVEGLALNGFVSLFGLNGDKIQNASRYYQQYGGPDRTRTYDPALIKRML